MNSISASKSLLSSPAALLSANGTNSSTLPQHPSQHPLQLPQHQIKDPTSPSAISYEGRLRVFPGFDLDTNVSPKSASGFKPKDNGFSSGGLNRPLFSPEKGLSLSVSVASLEKTPEKSAFHPIFGGHPAGGNESKSGITTDSLERLQEICDKSIPSLTSTAEDFLDKSVDSESGSKSYSCHICTFTSQSKDEYNSHINGHYEFRCLKCEFMTKEEEEYREHLKQDHDLTPEELEDEQGVRVPKVNSQGKVKTFKCKQCEFVAVTKEDFWTHTRTHIKPEKLLNCPKCPFVTEYKHHLDYHLRNHFGSKPYQCISCNYSCVNKSMLNSHMKSHLPIYQFRCADCTYATKYCHSLKLHLRKYNHKPSVVLNPDGTPNPLPIIDVYGTRRGPKIKRDDSQLLALMPPKGQDKQKSDSGPQKSTSPYHDLPQNPQGSLQSGPGSAANDDNEMQEVEKKFNCEICDFETLNPDIFENHIMLHDKDEEMPSPEATSSLTDSEEASIKMGSKSKSRRKSEDSLRSEKVESPAWDYYEYLKRMAPLLANQASPMVRSPSSSDTDLASSAIASSPISAVMATDPPMMKSEDKSALPMPMDAATKFSAASAIPASTELLSRWYLENFIKNIRHNNPTAQPALDKPISSLIPSNANNTNTNTEESDETDSIALDLSNTPDIDQQQHHQQQERTLSVSSSSKSERNDSEKSLKMSNGHNKANRRKGKAFKIKRKDSNATNTNSSSNVDDEQNSIPTDGESTSKTPELTPALNGSFICKHCEIAFMSLDMFEAHNKYHSQDNPFKCNLCGEVLEDQLSLYLHIAKVAHSPNDES